MSIYRRQLQLAVYNSKIFCRYIWLSSKHCKLLKRIHRASVFVCLKQTGMEFNFKLCVRYMKNFLLIAFTFVSLAVFTLPANAQHTINVAPVKYVTLPDLEVVIPDDLAVEYDRIEIRSGSETYTGKYIKSKKVFSFRLKLEEARLYRFLVDGFKNDDRIGTGKFSVERIKDDTEAANRPSAPRNEQPSGDPEPVKPPKPAATPPGKGAGPDKKNSLLALSIANYDEKNEGAVRGSDQKLLIVPGNIPETAEKYQITQKNGDSTNQKTEGIKKTSKKPDSPQEVVLELKSGKNSITVAALDKDGKVVENSESSLSLICMECEFTPRSVNTRAIVGFEQVGASSANSSTTPFLDLFINVPIGDYKFKPNKRVFSIWTDFRFSATSQQSFAALTNISTGLLNSISGSAGTFNNIVQSFNVTSGIEYELYKSRSDQPGFLPGKSAVSLIIGGGVTNPLSSDKTVQVFKIPLLNSQVNPEFAKLFPGVDFTNKTNVAFIQSERDRFYRRYFVGFRVKNYFHENENKRIDQSPAMVDFTIGQNEAITNRLQGLVFSMDGFTPFPIKKFDYVYLFGGVNMRFNKNTDKVVPFFLEAPQTINLFDTANVVIPIDATPFTRSNRDTFRFGIGIDLIRLINRSSNQTDTAGKPVNP
jgi:hypothetical protein